MTTTVSAPPPQAPPPPLSPGGRTAVRALLIAIAAAVAVGAVVSLTTAAWGVSRFRVVADSIALPANLRALTVDVGAVPAVVRITSDRAATEPRVDLRMVTAAQSGSNPLAISDDGRTARVAITSESSPVLRWGRAGQITVVLPPQLARELSVTTRQDMGVVFAQADVDQLIADTRDGAVVVSGSARTVEITNAHGEISTQEPISVSESFRATTSSGDIAVDFAVAPPTIDAETGHGDVDVAVPGPGPYLVNATTGRDHGTTVVTVPQTRDEDEAAAVITARSDTGDVVVDELR